MSETLRFNAEQRTLSLRRSKQPLSKRKRSGPLGEFRHRIHENALFVAIESGKEERAVRLIGKTKRVGSLEGDDTPLTLAATHGLSNVVKKLIGRGDDVNVSCYSGLSPLMCAVLGDHTEIAKTLIEAGADVLYRNSGENQSALSFALDLELGYATLDTIELVINELKNSKEGIEEIDRSAKVFIANPPELDGVWPDIIPRNSKYGEVAVLFETLARENMHPRGEPGSSEKYEAIAVLLEKLAGEEINPRTALVLSFSQKGITLMKKHSDRCVAQGISWVDIKTARFAVLRGNAIALEHLLRNGADAREKDNHGMNLDDYARACGHSELLRILRDFRLS